MITLRIEHTPIEAYNTITRKFGIIWPFHPKTVKISHNTNSGLFINTNSGLFIRGKGCYHLFYYTQNTYVSISDNPIASEKIGKFHFRSNGI